MVDTHYFHTYSKKSLQFPFHELAHTPVGHLLYTAAIYGQLNIKVIFDFISTVWTLLYTLLYVLYIIYCLFH